MSVRNLVQRLIASGVDPVDAAEIVAEAAILGASKAKPTRSNGAERQARYVERQRQKASESVTNDGNDVIVTQAALPLEERKSPTPPKETQSLSPSKNPPKGGQKGSRRCPEQWAPSGETLAKLEAEGHDSGDLERALTRMRDHEFRTARVDWDATYRNWVRADAERNPRKANVQPPDRRLTDRHENYARAFAGASAVARRQGGP